MTRRFFTHERPDRFCTGTVGEPGKRVFYLQVSQVDRVTTVVLEKVQVAALADRVLAVVAELQRRGLLPDEVDAQGDDDGPLATPLREEFRVGSMTITWDEEQAQLLLEARSITADDEDADEEDDEDTEATDEEDEEDEDEDEVIPDDALEGPDVLRIRVTAAMAIGFARRAARVVAAGRPPCPFCGQPLDPGGHLCPRRNGSGYLH